MNPLTQPRSHRHAWDRLSQVQSHAELCTEFSTIVGSLIPFDAELYLPGPSRNIQDAGERSRKTNSDYIQEWAQSLNHPMAETSSPADIPVFTLPVIHAGNVEAICCLRRRGSDATSLNPPQIYDLISICDVAAKAIANLSKSSEGTHENGRPDDAPTDTARQRSLGAVFSKVMGSVAHDLRTPITVIRGFIKMILDGRAGEISDAQRKCLDVAFESVNRLVEYSGTVGGSASFLEHFQAEEFEIREIWMSVARAIWSQLDEKGISVSEFIEPGMVVSGDRGLLFEVIEKSILSMIESIRGGGRLRIEISRRASGDVSFQVSLPEERDCVNPTEVVTQLHSVVLLHGGRLSFAVKPESGAILNLIFPGYTA